jgi:hypothetical protein
VRAGDVVWNPLTGEKAMIVESASDSGGTRIVADLAVEAGGFVPGGHRVATTSALRTFSPPCDASADTQRNYSAWSPTRPVSAKPSDAIGVRGGRLLPGEAIAALALRRLLVQR